MIQYEVWHKNDNRSGYPILVTTDKNAVDELIADNPEEYEVTSYMAWPVM